MRELRIQTRESPDSVVIVLEGELDVASAARLDTEVARCAGQPRIVIDLSGLSFMDSTGLRALVSASEAVQDLGREFAVIPGPPQVQRLLKFTRVAERLTFVSADGSVEVADR